MDFSMLIKCQGQDHTPERWISVGVCTDVLLCANMSRIMQLKRAEGLR